MIYKIVRYILCALLLLFFILIKKNAGYAYDYNNPQYQQYLKEAEQIKKNSLIFQKDGAENTNNIHNPQVQNNLQNLLGKENYNAEQIRLNSQNNKEKSISNLLIFISFSMPQNLIREYIQQAQDTGAILVLRGMIDKSISKTAIKLNNINNKQGVNAIIDPNLFKLYNIKRVPAIVVAKYSNYPCIDCKQTPIYDKISGSITLEYALEQIVNSRASSTKDMANNYLYKLRDKGGME